MGDIVTWQQTDNSPTFAAYSANAGSEPVGWVENYLEPNDKVPWRAYANCSGEAWFATLAEAQSWVESEVKGEKL